MSVQLSDTQVGSSARSMSRCTTPLPQDLCCGCKAGIATHREHLKHLVAKTLPPSAQFCCFARSVRAAGVGRFLLRAHRYQDRTISTEHSACPRMGWLRGPMRLTTCSVSVLPITASCIRLLLTSRKSAMPVRVARAWNWTLG
jgi:hypothetical protein